MSIKDDYAQAMELAKAGKFEQAQALLVAHDHPKTNALLEKVNAALAAQGKGKHSKEKAVKQRSPMFVVVGVVVTLAVLIIGYMISYTVYQSMQANQRAAQTRAANLYCHRYFALDSVGVSREAFDAACDETARETVLVYHGVIDYCLSQSQNGVLTQTLLDCMEEQIPYLSERHLEAAKDAE